MAIKSAPYYWIECDKCGYRGPDQDQDDVSAWYDVAGAIEYAECHDWMIDGDRHLCPQCRDEVEALGQD